MRIALTKKQSNQFLREPARVSRYAEIKGDSLCVLKSIDGLVEGNCYKILEMGVDYVRIKLKGKSYLVSDYVFG